MMRDVEKVEGAAAGYYVAALFESARPEHRGLNAAQIARDALSRSHKALGRLRLACRSIRVAGRPRTLYARSVARATGTRPRSAARVRGKPRPSEAA